MLIGTDGRLLAISSTCRELLDLDDHQSRIGLPWSSLFPESLRAQIDAAVAAAIELGTSRLVLAMPTDDGQAKWLDIAVTLVAGEDEKADTLLVVSRDITTLKAAERSLRVGEQRFRALADNMSQLAWMADRAGSIFWYNKRWFDYTGTTLPDMVGWGWRKVHHPDHVDRVVTKIAAHFESGEPWEDVFPLRGADGSFRWFLSHANALRDDAGNITLWCGTNTDVTEQRNSSQRLRQLARVLEMSHEAIMIWDEEHGILQWNRGCEQLYGFDKSEALSRNTHELLQTRHPVPREQFMRDLLAAGRWSGELQHRGRDGREVWVESRHEIIRVGGRDVVLETNRDITERRAADDLRNLLVAELNHRVKNTLAIAQSIALQSANTATDMRSFLSSFSGRLQSLSSAHNVLTDSHWAGADVRDLIASQLAVTAAPDAHVSLSGPEVFLPPQTALQLTLIVYELATNALKHGALSTEPGRVDVTWKVREASTPDEPARLVLTWTESGGQPVVRPSASGFGLTLIERSGRLPHMKTAVAFRPEGLVCTVEANLATATESSGKLFNPGRRVTPFPVARASVDDEPVRRARVLVVIADPMAALAVDEGLSDAGFITAGPALDSAAAAKAVQAFACDAVLLDLDMPGLTSAGIVDAIRQRGCPIVAITSERKSVDTAFEGGEALLAKPADIEAMVAALRAATASRD